ncbi:sugar-transfer associated ATP-grasp domain-containing protein [Paracoccus sp. (in: a-proteobacteria)]|uniref:sugar-transfer associated ATP-grasp domain-containing protein n=1 Tax=Paracoccus sp. TaxID=267 RepID=UPI0026DEDEBF|nr:sugar-transfer associated ATP-grasp domain-containing protein [Paracoccus sp. (in: a-proteobacteria)]MDO5647614.1 sugar-transfer associated ATP-grasp domain-containing protein [Paracoccus sp. (in: a-proteobacteria)]
MAYFASGQFFDQDWQPVAPDALRDHLFADTDQVVFKSDGGMRGVGVHVLTPHNLDVARILGMGDGCFQRFIRQHDDLAAFGSDAVATLRLITCAAGGEVRALCGNLRLGFAGQDHIVSDHGLRIPVDMASGALHDTGWLTDWSRVHAHPDSGVVFAGQHMPQMQDCVNACVTLHRKVPMVQTIGWDVTIDQSNRAQIMEWNVWHGVKVLEATTGPHFAGLGWETAWRDRPARR